MIILEAICVFVLIMSIVMMPTVINAHTSDKVEHTPTHVYVSTFFIGVALGLLVLLMLK